IATLDRTMALHIDFLPGMIYLHTYNPPIIHRDLKPGNLLVGQHWNVKVCKYLGQKVKHDNMLNSCLGDFGLARHCDERIMSHVGTVQVSDLWLSYQHINY